jgi:hypothetical protein
MLALAYPLEDLTDSNSCTHKRARSSSNKHANTAHQHTLAFAELHEKDAALGKKADNPVEFCRISTESENDVWDHHTRDHLYDQLCCMCAE